VSRKLDTCCALGEAGRIGSVLVGAVFLLPQQAGYVGDAEYGENRYQRNDHRILFLSGGFASGCSGIVAGVFESVLSWLLCASLGWNSTFCLPMAKYPCTNCFGTV